MNNQMGGSDLNQWIERENDQASWRDGKSTAILDGFLDLVVDESDNANYLQASVATLAAIGAALNF